MLSEAKHLWTSFRKPEQNQRSFAFAQDDNWHSDIGVPHRFPLKSLPKIRLNPRDGRSVCMTCANFTRPIAVENWGFSTADVTPHAACACVRLAGISKMSAAR